MNIPRGLAALSGNTPSVFLPNAKAAERFFDFFTANIRNKHTRRAYYKAACRFSRVVRGQGTAAIWTAGEAAACRGVIEARCRES